MDQDDKDDINESENQNNNNNSAFYIVKFPRTKHITNLGSATRDDLLMTQAEANNFLNKEIIIEEKIDGANMGISINKDGKILVQNRSHYVTSQSGAQFKPLDKWIAEHSAELWEFLEPDVHILYGEWLYMKHSIKYNRLEDWFMAFDIFDKRENKFYSRNRVEQLLEETTIKLIPTIARGTFKKIDELKALVNSPSRFCDNHKVEGIYCRICDDNYLINRGKIVRTDFISGNAHWSKGIIEQNEIVNDNQ
jgi:atypical dual specificity phosphatase